MESIEITANSNSATTTSMEGIVATIPEKTFIDSTGTETLTKNHNRQENGSNQNVKGHQSNLGDASDNQGKNILAESLVEEFNVTIHVGEQPNVRIFHAHSLILKARSSYFNTALSKQWAKQKDEKNILNQPNISPEIFEIILRLILPPNLEDDIVRCHLKQGSKPIYGINTPRGNSTLIGHKEISSSASNIPATTNEMPYKFKLLVRGTRDGFDSKTFHQKCDNQGPTFVIMKISSTNEVIGGYNPIKWQTGSGHLETRDSFLFTFGNRDRIEDAKVSRVSRFNYAITLKDDSYGPCFGDKDLWMYGRRL
ncbi:3834_t:CDS:2 [Entrophospora sp. SA101]|nr:3834_t:CDS:2 [Entrophospora sp. SA101]